MNRRSGLVLLVVASAVFYLASPALGAEGAGGTTATAPANTAVRMKNSAFTPQSVVVGVNTSVTWTNAEAIEHDVTIDSLNVQSPGGAGGMKDGNTFAYNFTAPGVYEYYCTKHSTGPGNLMWGSVTVQTHYLPPAGVAGAGAGANPEEVGVNWLAHWVGIMSFVAVVATLLIYYFVLKYGESIHTTDHRDRKEK